MEIAGVVGAGIGIVANVTKLGNEFVHICVSIKEARDELTERTKHVESLWLRTRVQLEFMSKIWTRMSDEHKALQVDIQNQLMLKFKAAIEKLNSMLSRARPGTTDSGQHVVRRWKYIFLKSFLDDTIKSLDRWQQMFDPSWFLLIRISSTAIDLELREIHQRRSRGKHAIETATRVRQAISGSATQPMPVFSDRGLQIARSRPIAYSSATHVQRKESSKCYIIDSVPFPVDSGQRYLADDIQTLTSKLNSVDSSTFGVLRCKGLKKNKDSTGRVRSMELVFWTPDKQGEAPEFAPPRTLRACLLSQVSHTLTERMHLARQLAAAVNYVHTLDFVHKNISPENLIGFSDSDRKLGSFFLIGFEHIRSANGMTYRRGDRDWHKNIYRHPERQGLHPREAYRMHHDIYSLGVCLLEIGMWKSFVLYGDDGRVKQANAELLGLTWEELSRKRPVAIKGLLVGLANRTLPGLVGEIYKDVVVSCLTCLDADNADFGVDDDGESVTEDVVAVGVNYIEKVLLRLNSISV